MVYFVKCMAVCRGVFRTIRLAVSKWRRDAVNFLKDHRTLMKCLLLLAVSTFCVVMPLILKDNPYSSYFKLFHGATNYTLDVINSNKMKYEAARRYFEGLGSGDTGERSQVEITFVVISTRRYMGNDSLGYLTQNVATLHRLTTQTNRRTDIFICDVFDPSDTQRNTEAEWLSKYFRSVHGGPKKKSGEMYEREKLDYVYCLKQALQTTPKPRYLIVVEDDVIAHAHLLPVIDYLVINRPLKQWVYVKFYTLSNEQNFWSDHLVSIADIICYSLSFGLVFQGIYYVILMCDVRFRASRGVLTFVFIYGVVFGVMVCGLTGRPNILELKRLASPQLYRLIPPSGASTVAIMYSSMSAERVGVYLTNHTCSKKLHLDFALENYVREGSLRAYSIEPNLVQHIGFVSSLRGSVNRNLGDFLQYYIL